MSELVGVSPLAALGARPLGSRCHRVDTDIARSAQFDDGRFRNADPIVDDYVGIVRDLITTRAVRRPPHALNVVAHAPLDTRVAEGARITWLGHASTLIDLDGARILIDPVWSNRPSPLSWVGPSRWDTPLQRLDALGPLDAVLLSHDHYDHLDAPTLRAIVNDPANRHTRFITPLGVGAHLERWGVPRARITELDWWDEAAVRDVRVTATPARHASGRVVLDRDSTLWSGFALHGSERIYYSGDTGMQQAFVPIGERLGPFDISLMQSGAYGDAWPHWHMTPEEAVAAHRTVRAQWMLPVHWGLFTLAYHAWDEPGERLVRAASAQGVSLALPRPGEPVAFHARADAPVPTTTWWRMADGG